MNTTIPSVGQVFQSTASRSFTENGVKGVHVRTTEWEITECDGEFMTCEAVGIVSETNRPSFAGYPQGLTLLVSSYVRRIATGEIKAV